MFNWEIYNNYKIYLDWAKQLETYNSVVGYFVWGIVVKEHKNDNEKEKQLTPTKPKKKKNLKEMFYFMKRKITGQLKSEAHLTYLVRSKTVFWIAPFFEFQTDW